MKNLEQKAYDYAIKHIGENSTALLKASPFPDFVNTYVDAYKAGAEEALTSQWIDHKDELPPLGVKVIIRYRTRYEGSWLTLMTIDDRNKDWDIFTHKDKEIEGWMYIPPFNK